MASFTLDTINGKAFNRGDYDVDSMMKLDAETSQFYLYFHAIENAKVKIDNKWQAAAVYVSGTHHYLRYRLLKAGEKSDTGVQTFYQFADGEFITIDRSREPFDIHTDADTMTFSVGNLEVKCAKSRDFNICVFSMEIADRFLSNKKSLFQERALEGMTAYVYDDHAKRMGLQMDEIRLIQFTLEKPLIFFVHDEFSDVLEQGIMYRPEIKVQKYAANGKLVPANLAMVKSAPAESLIPMAPSYPKGEVKDYKWMGKSNVPIDHPISFYLDKSAKLYGNASAKTLFYTFSAYGRRGIELHFVSEAEYYTVGNLLYLTIQALGGDPAPTAGGSSSVSTATLADVEAKAKQQEDEISPLEELNSLVGMTQLKNDVQELISLVRMQKMREEKGMKSVPVTLHLVFTGNPGTGKTTVARILGKLYKEIGALSKGQLVECDRSGLVAGYIGHTAIQTQKKIDEAMGGILFIDEAYTLAKEGNDFGQEAIDTLLKAMEDHRKDFVVIVAGYPDLMQKFINSNPGLKSRFNKYMYFPDYTAEELVKIFESNCKKYDYKMDEGAREAIYARIEKMVEEKDENFANAREVRNLFETIITNQASRVDKLDAPQDEDLITITLADVEAD